MQNVPAHPPKDVLHAALRSLRKPKSAITGTRILDEFALLVLPFYTGSDAWHERAELFASVLPLAIARSGTHAELLQHIFITADDAIGEVPGVNERYTAAGTKLDKTASQIRGQEKAAISALVDVLVSRAFAEEVSAKRGIDLPTATVPDDDRGYAFSRKTARLAIDVGDERKHVYLFRYEFVITRSNMRVISLYFEWTDTDFNHPVDQDQDIRVLSPGHSYLGTRLERQIVGPPESVNHFSLGEAPRLGRRHVLSWVWHLRDDGGTFCPYLTLTGETSPVPIYTELELPRSSDYRVLAGAFKTRNLERLPVGPLQEVQPDDDGCFRHPSMGTDPAHHYGLIWEDKRGDIAYNIDVKRSDDEMGEK